MVADLLQQANRGVSEYMTGISEATDQLYQWVGLAENTLV